MDSCRREASCSSYCWQKAEAAFGARRRLGRAVPADEDLAESERDKGVHQTGKGHGGDEMPRGLRRAVSKTFKAVVRVFCSTEHTNTSNQKAHKVAPWRRAGREPSGSVLPCACSEMKGSKGRRGVSTADWTPRSSVGCCSRRWSFLLSSISRPATQPLKPFRIHFHELVHLAASTTSSCCAVYVYNNIHPQPSQR